jgi:hypothetical protein
MQADQPVPAAARIVQISTQAIVVQHDRASILSDHYPGVREGHALRCTLEQCGADLLLEKHDLAADGGRGDIRQFGSFADRPRLRDSVECPQFARKHHV